MHTYFNNIDYVKGILVDLIEYHIIFFESSKIRDVLSLYSNLSNLMA